MSVCNNCGHQKHLHVLGLGKCKASDCSCWSFAKTFKAIIKFFKG